MMSMPDQLYLLGNIVIMVAYAAIMVAIVVPVARAGQLRTNKLAVATALIFFSCAVGHGIHALLSYRSIVHGAPRACHVVGLVVVGRAVGRLHRRRRRLLLDPAAWIWRPARQGRHVRRPCRQRRLDAAGERERAARAAAENHRATLAAVVEHTADAIIGATPDGVITAWNAGAERLFGYTADEAVGRHAFIVTEGDGTDEQTQLLARIRAGERSLSYEAQRVHKDGSALEVAFTVAPIVDRAGTVIGISVVARDIAAAKEAAERQRAMQERTHQAQKMESLGRLAGGVAHDFNNLLDDHLGYSRLRLLRAARRRRPREPTSRDVRTAARARGDLTRQLLAFSRRQRAAAAGSSTSTRSSPRSQAMLRRLIGEDVELTVPLGRGRCGRVADPGQIEQVLLNLARQRPRRHARRRHADASRPRRRARRRRARAATAPSRRPLRACSRSADTGEGMSADVARARSSSRSSPPRPRGKGTGLGLATVYGIVAESGGASACRQRAPAAARPSRSTCRCVADVRRAGAAPAARADTARGDGTTVLVVEDEPALRLVATRSSAAPATTCWRRERRGGAGFADGSAGATSC